MDAICISDLHLGSDICQGELLEDFLKDIRRKNLKKLILNGDVFDSWDFRRLKKHQWGVLSRLRKMSKEIETIYVSGNHDGPAELISNLIGIKFVTEYVLKSGDKLLYFHHGHRYDTFLDAHPFLSWAGDVIYWLLQKMDSSFTLARNAKYASKSFMRNSQIIEAQSKKFAAKRGFDVVCCGHTHYALERPGKPAYYNSGSWTELPCTYLTIDNGQVKLHEWHSKRPTCDHESGGNLPSHEHAQE